MEDIRAAIQQLFLEPAFITSLQELLSPGLEAAVSKALEKQDAKIAALEQELVATKTELLSAKVKLTATQEKLSTVEHQVEQMEAENRKNCLVISGVPELPDENTDELVLGVANAAGITLSIGDIDRSHRLGKQHGTIDRPRTILVKFQSCNKRQQLFSARRELSAHRVRENPVLTPQVLQGVYLTDFLTQKNQHLLFVCRQLRKRKQLWASYSSNGKVKARLAEDQPARPVNSISDLQAILGHDNRDLREILEAAAPLHHDRTAAGAAGAAPHQAPNRAAGGTRGGQATTKERRQSPRHAEQTR